MEIAPWVRRLAASAAFTVLVAPAGYAAEPDWVKTGGRTARRPPQRFLTGFALVEGASALERAKVQAAADLARSITVRIQSELSDVTAEKNGAQQYSIAAFTRATSDVRLDGLAYETHAAGNAGYALAYIDREDAAKGQRRVRDDALSRAKSALAAAKAEQGKKQDAAALALYYDAKRALAEALEHDAILGAIAARDAAQVAALAALAREIDEGVRASIKRPINTYQDAAEVLAMQLGQQGVSARSRLTIEPPTYGSTSFTSPFGRQLATDLERALAAQPPAKTPPPSDVVLRGSYVELGKDLEVTVLARDVKSGATLGSAAVRLPAAAVPAAFPIRPQNFTEAMEAQKLFQHGEEVSGDLKLEVWTNKGERGLVFNEGDEVKLYLRVNQPAYVRLIYLLANGLRVPLQQAYYIDASKVNRAVEYPDTFVVSPPFGVEHVYATAFTKEPDKLATKKVVVEGEEYEVISDDLRGVVVKTRGLKKKEAKAQSAEASLALTTMSKK